MVLPVGTRFTTQELVLVRKLPDGASRRGSCCRSPSCRSPVGMTDLPPRPPLASVALVSSAALAAEILLSRLFAVVHWHHFAYMIISLALLGFGASGTYLALAHRRLLRRFAASFLGNIAAFSVMVVASPLLASALPFRAEALLWDPVQPLWLVALFSCWRCRSSAPPTRSASRWSRSAAARVGCMPRTWPRGPGRRGGARAAVPGLAGAGTADYCGHGLAGGLRRRARAAGASRRVDRFGDDRPGAGGRDAGGAAEVRAGALQGPEPGAAHRRHAVVLERSSPLGLVSVVESPRVPLRSRPA